MKKLKTVEQQPRYQLKKLSIGLVSTLAGMRLMLTNPVMVQAADEADAGLTDSDVTTAPTTEPYKPVTNATTTPVPGATEAVSEATWNLTGLGNAQFGTVNYTANDQTLTVTGNGRQPQSAFGSALYNTVTVTRNDQTVYRHDYYGNQGVKFNDHVAVVPADVITIFQSEPNRIKVTPTTLKATGLASPKTFAYQVQTDGKLVNLTDYLAIAQNLQALFADAEQTKLRFGLSPNDLAQVTKTVAENPTLNPEQRQQLQAVVAKAEQLLKQRPAGLAIGTSATLPIFSVAPNATTNKEGRTMANTMDRQALGITMNEGATIRVKVTSDQSKVKTVTLDLIDSSSQNEQLVNLSVNGDWVTVTAAADQVPYLKTPNSGDYQLTYEVVGGRVDQLPIFTYGMNETEVEQQWDQTKAPYALFKSYNMQLQIPYADLLRVVATDMNSLLTQYDDQVFKLYGELAGIPYNTSDTPIIRRYFGMADKNGIGAAYYHPSKWIAINGASVGSYLLIGWLTLHEIAHGYELPSSTMSIIDNFNNVYGTIYQAKYTYPDVATFNQKSWLYGGNRDKVITQVVDEVLNQHQTFNQIGLRDRLLLLLSLADYRTTDSWRVFNQYHRDVANAGKPANDLGKMWADSFEQAYQVDATPFFQTIGVPIDPVTQSNVISTDAKALTTLHQVVPENQLAPVMQQLGWSKDVLKTPLSLVTTDELASTGLTGTTNLTVHQAQLAAGKQILVKNGSQVVRTLTVPTDTTADFTTTLRDLPIGIYTLVSEDPQVSIDQPYLYVTASQVNDATISLGDELLNELKALYTDQTLTNVKPTVPATQIETVQMLVDQFNNPAVKAVNQTLITRAHNLLEQVNLTGAGYGIFATINDNNGDGSLTLQTYPVEPHWGFGEAKYATITIYDQDNQIVYERTFIANQV
ncbi:MAG: M60 family metallopeptidase, partial [Limosilactobacillus sp.]|nr:M60 family metallopeptidase [Limosilactobacillus sp.]